VSGPINREIDLAHDNDGDSDFGLRHKPTRACSKFALTLSDKSGQSHKLMITPSSLWIPGYVVTFVAVCATRVTNIMVRRKVSGMI
jgi:hypothetical protein